MKASDYPEIIALYLENLASLGKSSHTLTSYRASLTKFSDFLRGIPGETEVDPDLIAEYRSQLRESDLSANTVRQHLTILHAFHAKLGAFLTLTGRTPLFNPVLRDEIPEEIIPTYDDALTAEEIETLLHTKPRRGKYPVRNYCIIALFIQCGLRNSELRALAPADLDFENCTLTVKHGKGDKERQAPFPSIARQAVLDYMKTGIRPADLPATAPLFGSLEHAGEWGEYNINSLNALVKRYTRKIIGREIHCHLLRHAAASSWDSAGASLRDVQKALGHANVRTTERIYIQILDRHKAAQNITKICDAM